ncbi:zinc-binding dehydrogenase [Actinomadura montaniterrae]|uniref:Zinc-binding dehydrogenase n=1 Tax=Actinomadura montaniterrae TaxID=1803903 RepID=A0A6L3VRD6_9ACTN|nr:zinc-binding dehydrogenase [Actinomadura montaniterrae]KAB2372456.1 zinc-binding dehydrogenase [Actinomadura montaniterrae]
MKVVRVTRFGGPEVLVAGEAPEPAAGPGQVVVAVAVAEINFVETQLRRGITPGPPLPEPPYVPGGGVAGRVAAIGDGVAPEWLGRRVTTGTAGRLGGNAERAVADVDDLVPVPDGLDLAEAAALLHDGGTALGLFDGAGVRAGDRVLVEAAAGGLGSLLVQLALSAGARVVGAARGEAKLALVRELGAEAVDYSEPGWAKRVLDATGGFDVVFDGVGGEIGREAFGATARGGRFSVHGASAGAATVIPPEEAAERGVTVFGIEQLMGFGDGAKERVRRALDAAAAGRIRPVIGRRLPLERAADAHAAMEARSVVGKTLLVV